MPLLTQAIPDLLGGVSQQSPAIRSANQCESMVNAFPSVVEGLVKRSPSERVTEIRNASSTVYSSVTESNIKPHLIVRDVTEKYFVFIKPAATAIDSAIEVYDLSGNKITVRYDTDSRDYLVNATRDSLKLLTVADVTFVVNTGIDTALSNTTTTGINYERNALVFVRSSTHNHDYSITVSDSNGANEITVSHSCSTGHSGTAHLAEELAAALNGQGSPAYSAAAVDSVVYITRSVDFRITVEDNEGNEGLVLIRDEVERFEDLPSSAPNNFIVKVIGVPEDTIDDYYVKFETGDGQSFARGLWRESLAPGLKYAYDYASMPHLLIRQSDGSFLFKKADGGTPASPTAPAGADYSLYKWADRQTGDEETNSSPSFVGLPVQNIVLFKNRLGFLSDENIILSEVGEFFNFWRTTVLDIPDSDPIDIASSSPKIGKLKSGTVFNTELILFTDSSQLVLRGGEILSPRSVALLPVGDYESYSDIQPISSGLSVYFAYSRGSLFSGVREMVPQPNIDGSYIVNTITEIVPSYIAGKPVHITASAQEDMTAVVASGNLYLYKYAKSGDNTLQAAWFQYQFPDTVTGGFAKVLWAEFVEMELYVLLLRSDSSIPVLEKMRLGTKLTDSAQVANANWMAHLDQRILKASGTGTYDSATGLTTWTLPKPYSYNPKSAVYTTAGASLTISAGTSYALGSDTAGTISVRGDYSSTDVWIGVKYEMKYEFSQFWLKGRATQGMSPLQTGRHQLRNLSLIYEDTAYFKIKVNNGGENDYEYDYSGLVIGSSQLNQIYLNRGTFRFPIYGRNTTTTVTLVNETALPCKILSGEIEADYTDRATRYS